MGIREAMRWELWINAMVVHVEARKLDAFLIVHTVQLMHRYLANTGVFSDSAVAWSRLVRVRELLFLLAVKFSTADVGHDAFFRHVDPLHLMDEELGVLRVLCFTLGHPDNPVSTLCAALPQLSPSDYQRACIKLARTLKPPTLELAAVCLVHESDHRHVDAISAACEEVRKVHPTPPAPPETRDPASGPPPPPRCAPPPILSYAERAVPPASVCDASRTGLQ